MTFEKLLWVRLLASSLSRVVILDAPVGQTSDVWALVEPLVAKKTKVRMRKRERLVMMLSLLWQVCAYDRAGLGFSDRAYQVSEQCQAASMQQLPKKYLKRYQVSVITKLATGHCGFIYMHLFSSARQFWVSSYEYHYSVH